MKKNALERVNNLVGAVSNMGQKCICGQTLKLTSIMIESDYANARMGCESSKPGIHSSISIAERQEMPQTCTPDESGAIAETCDRLTDEDFYHPVDR